MILRPRLERAVALAASFLVEHRITQLPVDPQAIIRQCGWSVKSYSSVVKNSPDIDTIDELIAELNSPDAATLFPTQKSQSSTMTLSQSPSASASPSVMRSAT